MKNTKPHPFDPCSEQLIALVLAARTSLTEDAVRKAVGCCRQQGWDDRRLFKEFAGMLLRDETPYDVINAASGGVRRAG